MSSKDRTKQRTAITRPDIHARELRLIERHYGRMPRREFKERYLPGRTLKAVERRAALLGVTCRASKRPEYWTASEVELLQRHYGKIPNKELLARHLPQRSDIQLRSKAGELGLLRPVSRHWTLEQVVAEIRALHGSGHLASREELKRQGQESLVAAAVYYAGSWAKAVRLAGFDYVARRSWTKEAVLREIRRLHRAKQSVNASQVEAALLLAAKRKFGSWRKARAEALPSYDTGLEQWTREKLRDALADLHSRGVSLSANHVRATGEGRLINAAVRLFGSWDAARQRAIDDFTPLLQTWTKQRVVQAIRERHAQGLSLSSTDVAKEDVPLFGAAHRYFGGWTAARKTARVPYRDPRHSWPKERVIAELRRHAPDGIRPTTARIGQALYKVSIARFGSFDKACLAAGLRRSG
jgi:hypothetical protein